MPPKISDSQISSLLAALEALSPVGRYSEADRVFDATKPILEVKLREGCSPRQIIDSFRAEGIALGERRVASFVRSLAPKKRKRSRRRRAVAPTTATLSPTLGTPTAPVRALKLPARPLAVPKVEPPKPPQVEPVGAAPRPTTSISTKRRSNASLGDHY